MHRLKGSGEAADRAILDSSPCPVEACSSVETGMYGAGWAARHGEWPRCTDYG